MDKGLRRYHQELESSIKGMTPDEARVRLVYHVERVRDFQHERLVHLLVTLFFGGLVIVTVGALFVVSDKSVSLLLDGAVAVLLITDLFYISYYYRLENGVQKLYSLTDHLIAISGKN